MKKSKLVLINDTIFVFFSATLFILVALRFFSVGLAPSIVLALTCGGSFSAIFYISRRKKYALYNLGKAEEEDMNQRIAQLCLSSPDELKEYFAKLFEKMDLDAEVRDYGFYLPNRNLAVAFGFSFLETQERYIIELYKRVGRGENLLVFGNNFSNELYSLFNRFGGRISLCCGAKLYAIMKKYDCFPEIKQKLELKKPRFSELLKLCFDKRRAPTFLLYGAMLMLFSLFVFYPVYYLTVGGLFVIYAIICKFFGREKAEDNLF